MDRIVDNRAEPRAPKSEIPDVRDIPLRELLLSGDGTVFENALARILTELDLQPDVSATFTNSVG